MAFGDPLGDRMKGNYENRSKTYLTRRTPVIIRIDGKAFHTCTRGFCRPYDKVFHNSMNATLEYLCKNIQGCKFGYTQSDEITLVLTDYDKLTTDGWFDYSVQKMCSIAASMATLIFNRTFLNECSNWYDTSEFFRIDETERDGISTKEFNDLFQAYSKAAERGAMFDARCFNIPEDEVANCIIWRQNDATRNAVQMLGQTYFSHKELEGKSQSDIQDMLMEVHQINFNDMPVEFKRGICCFRNYMVSSPWGNSMFDTTKDEGEWVLDKKCPIISQDREYVERHVYTKEYKS